jgi:hypothetical protein
LERGPDRVPADVVLLAELNFAQLGSRLQLSREDAMPQRVGQGIDGGYAIEGFLWNAQDGLCERRVLSNCCTIC